MFTYPYTVPCPRAAVEVASATCRCSHAVIAAEFFPDWILNSNNKDKSQEHIVQLLKGIAADNKYFNIYAV